MTEYCCICGMKSRSLASDFKLVQPGAKYVCSPGCEEIFNLKHDWYEAKTPDEILKEIRKEKSTNFTSWPDRDTELKNKFRHFQRREWERERQWQEWKEKYG